MTSPEQLRQFNRNNMLFSNYKIHISIKAILLIILSFLLLFNYEISRAENNQENGEKEAIFSISNTAPSTSSTGNENLGTSPLNEEPNLGTSSTAPGACRADCDAEALRRYNNANDECRLEVFNQILCESQAISDSQNFLSSCLRNCPTDEQILGIPEPSQQPTQLSTTPSPSKNVSDAIDSRVLAVINPLGLNDPRAFVGRILNGVIGISGLIFLIMFVYSGLLFLIAGGEEGPIKKAKSIMTYSVIGIVVIAGAYIIVNTIFQAITTSNPLIAPAEKSVGTPTTPAGTPEDDIVGDLINEWENSLEGFLQEGSSDTGFGDDLDFFDGFGDDLDFFDSP